MANWSMTMLGFESELDVLEIRLGTLDPVVDIHVISEATVSFKGEPKPIHLDLSDSRWARWKDKIRHVVVEDMPNGNNLVQPKTMFDATQNDAWRRENYQRSCIERGTWGLEEDDIVLISDLDEIPNPEYWDNWAELAREGRIIQPALAMHVGKLNWRWEEPIPVIARFASGEIFKLRGPQTIRKGFAEKIIPEYTEEFGWHLSYMGGPKAIAHKIKQAAHVELSKPKFTDLQNIKERIKNGDDLFGRKYRQCEWVDLDKLPPYVQNASYRFMHLTCPRP